MRRSVQSLAGPVKRSVHTLSAPTRPRRCFHLSTTAALPRRRNFFTSNHWLSDTDKYASDTPTESAEELLQRREQPRQAEAKQQTKRNPARLTASKNLRLTSMAKKSKPSAVAPKRPTAAAEPQLDYHHTIRAICVAQSFDLDMAEEILRLHGFDIDPDGLDLEPGAVVHARSLNKGDIFVFSTGTMVAWSVPPEEVMKMATKHLLRAAELPQVDRFEVEDLEFTTDDTRETSYLKGEEVILGTKAEMSGDSHDVTLSKIAFSMGLARSPKLAVLENNLADFLDNARPMTSSLAAGSEVAFSRNTKKLILKKTGQLLSLRAQLNHYSELTDSLPDIFWDEESKFEGYYTSIGHALDVNRRINQVNDKIDYAHELMSILREISNERNSTRLEWIIIVLIAVEVVFELRRIYREEFVEGRNLRESSALS